MLRGQAIMLDFALAFLIFALAFTFITGQFDQKLVQMEGEYHLESMKTRADYAMEYLLKSPGNPENWETLDINALERPGLAFNDRELSEAKLAAFSNFTSDYNTLKYRMGIGQYDFYFSFSGVDDVNAGLEPGSNADEVTLERVAIYKGGIGVARLKLYRLT